MLLDDDVFFERRKSLVQHKFFASVVVLSAFR